LPNGRSGKGSIKVTPEHELWTPSGMRKAIDIEVGDNVFVQSSLISEEAEQVVLGGILGDGYLNVRRANTPMFMVGHSIKQEQYCLWKAGVFGVGVHYAKRDDGKAKYDKISFETPRLPALLSYYNLSHDSKTGRKIVTRQLLDKITELGLAVWIMDDGSINTSNGVKGSRNPRANIWTCAFEYAEQETIKKWFLERWGILCEIVKSDAKPGKIRGKDVTPTKKTYYHISFNVEETAKLLKIIGKYIGISPNGSEKTWKKKYNRMLLKD
jgi:hypothetical protein